MSELNNSNRAILPGERSTKELTDWLESLKFYNEDPDAFFWIDEDLLNEIIKRLQGGKL